MKKEIIIHVVLVSSFFQCIYSLTCGPNEHDLNGLRCCKKCPPGRGVEKTCNRENDTQCAPCRKGEMFSAESSHVDTCELCTICPQYSHVKKHCNETQDTICECDLNYYWDEVSKSCHQCDLCPMGFGVKRQCDLHRNSVCSQCPQGTYSDVISNDACKVCTSCEVNQLMLRYCDSMHDTQCVDMPSPPSATPFVMTTSYISVVTATQHSQSTHDKLIPVYCGVLGLVILLLIIYVIVKQIHYKRNPPNNKKNVSYSAVSEPVTPQGSGGSNIATNIALQPGASKTQGSDSGVSVEIESKQVSKGMKVKEIPAMKLQTMEKMLQNCHEYRGGWTSFARELGYSNVQLASVETTSRHSGHMPAEVLVGEWSSSENATVGVLVKTLGAIGREDIINMLYTTDVRNLNGGNMHSPSGNNIPNMSDIRGLNNGGILSQNQISPGYQQQYNNINGPQQYNVNGPQSNPFPNSMDNRIGNIGSTVHSAPTHVTQMHNLNNVQQNSYPFGVTAGVVTSQGHIPNVTHGHVGSNSLSGSSTTDVSGMYGRPVGYLPPSYHHLSAQQMV